MDAPPSRIANVSSRFEELAWAHNQLFATAHQTALFLPWYRYLLHGYENMLREECGYDAPFPWWYELQDARDFASSGLFEPEYFDTLHEIKFNGPDEPVGRIPCVEDGISVNRTISVGLEKPQCLKRGEVKHYSTWAIQEIVDACEQKNVTDYVDHAECVNIGIIISSIHSATHAALGEVMAYIPASPNDPVFFMHHSFIDWQWRRWQLIEDKRSETSGCFSPGFINERLISIVSGCIYDTETENAPCTPATLQTVLTSNGVFPDMTIGDVIYPAEKPLCYEYDMSE